MFNRSRRSPGSRKCYLPAAGIWVWASIRKAEWKTTDGATLATRKHEPCWCPLSIHSPATFQGTRGQTSNVKLSIDTCWRDTSDPIDTVLYFHFYFPKYFPSCLCWMFWDSRKRSSRDSIAFVFLGFWWHSLTFFEGCFFLSSWKLNYAWDSIHSELSGIFDFNSGMWKIIEDNLQRTFRRDSLGFLASWREKKNLATKEIDKICRIECRVAIFPGIPLEKRLQLVRFERDIWNQSLANSTWNNCYKVETLFNVKLKLPLN